MAKSNDDLADALNALAAGEVADDHHTGSGVEHHQEPPAAAPPPARPPAAKPKPAAPQPPAAARPVAPQTPRPTPAPRPAAPATPRSAAPTPQRPTAPRPTAPPAARPSPPARPTAPPVEPPAAPAAKARPTAPPPVRPTAPPPPPQEEPAVEEAYHEEEGAEALEHGHVVETDELDIAAPTPDVFRAKPKPAPVPRKHYTHTLQFKQTIIPVMLTVGALCLISAVLPFLAPADSNLAAMKQPVFLGVMAVVGVIFLIFGLLNALQVKSILDQK